MRQLPRLAVASGVATLLASLVLTSVTADQPWLALSFVTVVLVGGSGLLARRLRVPVVLIPALQAVVCLWWVVLACATNTTVLGVLPTPSSFSYLGALGRAGIQASHDYPTPAPSVPGITYLIVVGVAVVAWLVDVFAVTLRRAPLAGLPLAAMYVAGSVLLIGGVSWFLFVLLAVGFLVLLVADGRVRVAQWGRPVSALGSRAVAHPETSTLTRSGERVGAAAVVLAVLVPALVPGLTSGLSLGGSGNGTGGDGETIRTDNPIVDLKRDLLRPRDVEVLRYKTSTPTPDYLRTVTLDNFDGNRWETSSRRVPTSQRVNQPLPSVPGLGDAVPRTSATYDITVSKSYESRWLPLAYPARSIKIAGDWRFDSGSLDVVARRGDTRGVTYTESSWQVQPAAGQLRLTTIQPGSTDLIQLPIGTTKVIGDLARQITAEGKTAFERAALLQAYFRNNFNYSLDRVPGTSTSALTDFLRDRSGYCEQFAATMAIMARTLNIPSRVAVGFLPGQLEGTDTWVVTAHDAHAWPELYFDGVGWVRFEPTPSSRTGTAPSWTLQTAATTAPTPTDIAPAPAAEDPNAIDKVRPDANNTSVSATPQRGFPWRWAIVGVAVLAVLALPAATAIVRRRVRWQRAHGDPAAEAEAAWGDLRESARDAGLPWDSASTPRVVGATIGATGLLNPDGRELVSHVVGVTEQARYASTPAVVEDLHGDSVVLRKVLISTAPRRRRVLSTLWPSGAHDILQQAASSLWDSLDWLDTVGGALRRRLVFWHRH